MNNEQGIQASARDIALIECNLDLTEFLTRSKFGVHAAEVSSPVSTCDDVDELCLNGPSHSATVQC